MSIKKTCGLAVLFMFFRQNRKNIGNKEIVFIWICGIWIRITKENYRNWRTKWAHKGIIFAFRTPTEMMNQTNVQVHKSLWQGMIDPMKFYAEMIQYLCEKKSTPYCWRMSSFKGPIGVPGAMTEGRACEYGRESSHVGYDSTSGS